MGFHFDKRRMSAWLHFASLLLCIITSPCALSAPNRIPPSPADNSTMSTAESPPNNSTTSTTVSTPEIHSESTTTAENVIHAESTTATPPEHFIHSETTTAAPPSENSTYSTSIEVEETSSFNSSASNDTDSNSNYRNPQSFSSSSSSSSSMYTMLSQGEAQTDVSQHNKSAIFLLGNKGSGQAVLAQTIITNYQMEESSSVGTTSYAPQYMVNQENSMAFYNFPGFEASMSPEADTASAYFMDKVTKHVSQVKFLFTATHSSVQQASGGNGGNSEFDLMVTKVAKLLTPSQAGKFSSSIGLVVTNVQGDGFSDQEILSGVETFLVSYKAQLTAQLNGQGMTAETRILVQRKITFVEALLRRAVGGGQSLNCVWFLRGDGGSTGTTPSSGGSTGTTIPSSSGSTGTTTPSSGGSTGTTIPSSSGSTGTTTPSSSGSTGTTIPSSSGSTGTTTPSHSGSTGTTTPSSSGSTGTTTPSSGGSTGTTPNLPEGVLNARRNITDLYLTRLQFSSVTQADFTISLATQTLTSIQTTFMPQISSIMQADTSSAVSTVVTSYYTKFFQSAFINQGTTLSSSLASLNLDYNSFLQSGMISLTGGLTSIFTHPLGPSTHVFHLDVFTKLSEFLKISFSSSYLSSMGTMSNWVVFFQAVTQTTQTGPTITETAFLSTFNQIRTFRDRVSREICNTNCGIGGGIIGR